MSRVLLFAGFGRCGAGDVALGVEQCAEPQGFEPFPTWLFPPGSGRVTGAVPVWSAPVKSMNPREIHRMEQGTDYASFS